MEDESVYLDAFSQRLETNLLGICKEKGFASDRMLESDDMDGKFSSCFAEGYFTDAIKEVNAYPEVSLAWAGFLGMGAAKLWDTDINAFNAVKYEDFKGQRGFDDMDEKILGEILGYGPGSREADSITDCLNCCATAALNMIRHENIEPSSARAYYVFARATESLYRIGVSVELHLLGYRMQNIN